MRNKKLINFSIILFFLLVTSATFAQYSIKKQVLKDGVEHWYLDKPVTDQPWFFQQLENLFDVVLTNPAKQPFGKSVAFLVGVSEYQYLKKLPFVKNDLEDMRQFLLTKGGFDEVYLVRDKRVNRDLIEIYMRNKFPDLLQRTDRLLFYYSGHGADLGGQTGYMQFSEAESGSFTPNQMIPISDALHWCSESDISHLLFIFDCCASGLAFGSKGETGNDLQTILSTLSKNGSRTIITAGTAEENTYEVKHTKRHGNGVFTRAFLNALETGLADTGCDGLVTIDEIMARAKREIAQFAARYHQSLTPRMWSVDESDYRGTFVFLNPQAKKQKIEFNSEYANVIAAKPKPRGETVAAFGILQVIAYVTGELFLDNQSLGQIESGDAKDFYNVAVGRHKISIQTGTNTHTENVTVEKGKRNRVTIGVSVLLREEQTRPKIQNPFRSNPQPLSSDEVKSMLKKHNFFDKYKNKNATGFDNDFKKQNGQLVYDRATGLMWQQSGSSEYMNYKAAKKYIDQLNRERFAGFTDWRLPTLEEAMSLMESKEMNGDLYIDPIFDKTQRYIWTADQVKGESWAWVVGFINGLCSSYRFDFDFYVRAVRSGQSSGGH